MQHKTATVKRNAIPRYAQIYESIRTRISSGELKVGDRLEPERQLAAQFQVTQMTVRQALDLLERDGLLERKHGSGTFVSAPRINWNRLMSFTEQMALRGLKVSSQLLSSGVVRADPASAEQLHIACGARLVRIERLRIAGDEPLAVEVCVLPLGACPQLLAHPLDRTSLFRVLEEHYRLCISHAEETIEIAVADTRMADLLKVPTRSPLLKVHQLLFAWRDQPIAISTGWYRADRHTFKVVRTRSDKVAPV